MFNESYCIAKENKYFADKIYWVVSRADVTLVYPPENNIYAWNF